MEFYKKNLSFNLMPVYLLKRTLQIRINVITEVNTLLPYLLFCSFSCLFVVMNWLWRALTKRRSVQGCSSCFLRVPDVRRSRGWGRGGGSDVNREALLDYTRLVWARGSLAFCCTTWLVERQIKASPAASRAASFTHLWNPQSGRRLLKPTWSIY